MSNDRDIVSATALTADLRAIAEDFEPDRECNGYRIPMKAAERIEQLERELAEAMKEGRKYGYAEGHAAALAALSSTGPSSLGFKELRIAFEDLLENAPLDFMGTGDELDAAREKKDWERRALRLRVAIEQAANEPAIVPTTITHQPIVHNNHEWPAECADITGAKAIRWRAADGNYRWMLHAEAICGTTYRVPSTQRITVPIPDGWQIVPKNASPEMVQAAEDRHVEGANYIAENSIQFALWREVWKAMLRTAPKLTAIKEYDIVSATRISAKGEGE